MKKVLKCLLLVVGIALAVGSAFAEKTSILKVVVSYRFELKDGALIRTEFYEDGEGAVFCYDSPEVLRIKSSGYYELDTYEGMNVYKLGGTRLGKVVVAEKDGVVMLVVESFGERFSAYGYKE